MKRSLELLFWLERITFITTLDTTPKQIAEELIDRLFALPGDFTITLRKEGDKVEIMAGTRRDFYKNLGEVAREFGVSVQTVRRRFINTKRLRRTPNGFRRGDVERLKKDL
jgi:hypothetical protein